jgi:hypothetical protein
MADSKSAIRSKSIGSKIGRVALAGLGSAVVGGLVLLFGTGSGATAAGVLLVVIGLLIVFLAPAIVLTRLPRAGRGPGERYRYKYGGSLGWIASMMDRHADEPYNTDRHD